MTAEWWKTGVVYQVYPRSFQDTDGDGVGDLKGISRRLGYLAGLGVDAVWISPIFPSPMADFGYDVSDYCGVDPMFGDLADFDALVRAAHDLGLKVILDFVPNHTSEQHPWFIESRSSRSNARRDWYIWRDPAPGGGPPNNWLAHFGGSAWEWDAASGQYFYHAYLKQQPDLNWRNPAVRAAMYEVLRFWMRRGVDGFRIDVLWHLIKDAAYRDNPPNPDYRPGQAGIERLLQTQSTDQPDVQQVVAGLRAVADEFPGRVLIGEIYLSVDRLVAYYGERLSGVQMPFNFQLLQTPWRAHDIAAVIERYEGLLPEGAWPNWVLGNHDRPRIASRVGPDQARVAAMLLMTLRGTPTMYYGDELGLQNVPIPAEAVHDPWEKQEPGLGLGRDPVRTPMPWDGSANAGFTTGSPWLPLNADWRERNVEAMGAQPGCILGLYRDLIALRRARPVLQVGDYATVSAEDDVMVFERRLGEERIVVALNFSSETRQTTIGPVASGARLLSTAAGDDRRDLRSDLVLAPCEGVIVQP